MIVLECLHAAYPPCRADAVNARNLGLREKAGLQYRSRCAMARAQLHNSPAYASIHRALARIGEQIWQPGYAKRRGAQRLPSRPDCATAKVAAKVLAPSRTDTTGGSSRRIRRWKCSSCASK